MKIVNIEAKKVDIELSKPFSYSLATLTHLPYVIISIEFENGIVGYGESALGWDTTGEVQNGAMQIFGIIRPILLNGKIRSIRDIELVLRNIDTVVYGNTALKSGIEAALLDALGKMKNKPISKLFNAKKRKFIILQKTFSFEEQDMKSLNAFAKDISLRQADVLKFKVNNNLKNIKKTLEFVSNLNLKSRIVLDVNQGWKNAKIAINIIRKIEKYQIAWIEQPIHHSDFEGLAEIRKKTKIPIMADESCHNILDLENLYLRKSVDMINIKLAKCGGIIEAKKMINFCDKHKIKYILGDMVQSSLGTAANLHAATLGNFVSYDLTLPERIKNDPFTGLIFDGSKAYIPVSPGLGVEKNNI